MIDNEKIELSVRMLLEAIGEDPNREGLVDTPKRIARMAHEIFRGIEGTTDEFYKAQFNVDTQEFVTIMNIEFYSLCEHHLLPFFGHVHIGYVPNNRVLGLSKFYRIVDMLAAKTTIQEQLTNDIASEIFDRLECKGIIVAMEATHMCVRMRGTRKANAYMFTKKVLGNLDDKHIEHFMKYIGDKRNVG